jgi:nucleoid-associated protein YgaU
MSAVTLLLVAGLLGASETPETIEHVVQPGETLWSIAAQQHVYDDPYLWPLIYKFNRDQIKDPSRIYPNQRLQIPVQLAAEARGSARLEAGAPPTPPGESP